MASRPSFTLVAASRPGARSYTCATWSPYPQTRGASVKKNERSKRTYGWSLGVRHASPHPDRAHGSALRRFMKGALSRIRTARSKSSTEVGESGGRARPLATSAASGKLRRRIHTHPLCRTLNSSSFRAALWPASPGANTQPAGGWLIGSRVTEPGR
jgi:hypothetical protein